MSKSDRKADRVPHWGVWRHTPTCQLWEAVALSLNIEPRQVRASDWFQQGQEFRYREGREFDDRLVIATRQAGEPGGLGGVAMSADAVATPYLRSESRVDLATFAQWAAGLGWEMPAELRAMAERTDAEMRDSTTEDVGSGADDAADGELSAKGANHLLKIIYVLSEMAGLGDSRDFQAGVAIQSRAADLGLSISDKSAAAKIKESRDRHRKPAGRNIPKN
jgi:hypothetical protein